MKKIVCTLTDGDAVKQRLDEWRALADEARTVTEEPEGIAFEFAPGAQTASRVAMLAAAETDCCAWLDFAIAITHDATALRITAPPDGLSTLAAMFRTQ